MNATDSLRFFLPELFLICGAFLILIFDMMLKSKKVIGALALLTIAGTAVLAQAPSVSYSLFSGFYTLDPFTHFFRITALGITAITILISFAYKALPKAYEGEYYALLLFACLGLILMGGATNLLAIFLSIEFVSMLSYILVGFLKKDTRSKEASLKYLLYGSVASGVMLYGMSLLFGATGSIDLSVIQHALSSNNALAPVSLFSFVLILVGLGFKISMAPFHMWAPDAYEAAPTPITAFLTVGPKALGFAVFIRVLSTAFAGIGFKWSPLLIGLSILTMTVGNIIAISQNNIKRLLAYSSIAQAGYIMMGLAVFNETGLSGILIYLVAYAFTNLGAFTAVIIASNHTGSDDINSYAGLSKRSPFLAASLLIFLLSLAGIPPLAGFVGKFFVFSSAIQGKYYLLAVAAAINSAIAGYYYFRIVRMMYLVPSENQDSIPQPAVLTFALSILLVGTVVLGLMPSPLISFVKGMLLV